jgi:hypothetical protein
LIRILSSTGSSENHEAILAGQEFIQMLKTVESPNNILQRLLLQRREHTVLDPVLPNHTLRQQLAQDLVVCLSIEQADGSVMLQDATITPNMLQDICAISDDLKIPEVAAMSLYQQAVTSEVPFQSNYVRSMIQNSNVSIEPTSIPWMAREIYYSQSPLLLHACMALLQQRLRESNFESPHNPATEITDILLQSDWISNFIQTIRDYTQQINGILVERSEGRAVPGISTPFSESTTYVWRHDVLLQTYFRERQLAADCLFFIAYHVQMKADEVVALIGLVRDLTNNCLVLNPYTDVPDPYELVSVGTTMSSSLNFNLGTPWLNQQAQKEKDELVWERQLVTTAWTTGQPQLLQCSCTVLVAIISALGDRVVFMDRMTHAPNEIGVVSLIAHYVDSFVHSLTCFIFIG